MHGTHDEHCTCGCGGHDHGHEHHHHDHECCGGHDHHHDHDHECCGGHDHGHEHHHHDHECGCGCGCGGHEQVDENVAILTYMLDHNRHHALELKEIAAHLRTVGKDEAAAQIEKGVEDFEKGNMRLSIALSLVK
ncbi:MAG: cobalt transporter [Lachnospiraceae bacterium]|nr:cobalt transporter [Lachnospiraceae bacterium]